MNTKKTINLLALGLFILVGISYPAQNVNAAVCVKPDVPGDILIGGEVLSRVAEFTDSTQEVVRVTSTVRPERFCNFDMPGTPQNVIASYNKSQHCLSGTCQQGPEYIGGISTPDQTFVNTFDVSDLDNGTYSVSVAAIGWEGSDSDNTSFTVDNRSDPSVDLKVRKLGTGSYTNGPLVVIKGYSIQLQWTVGGSPSGCSASGAWSGSKDSSDGNHVEPSGPLNNEGSFTYRITCEGVQDTVVVNVVSDPSVDFKVRKDGVGSYIDGPLAVDEGDSIQLQWTVDGSPSSCSASGAWSGQKGSSDGMHIESDGPLSEGDYTYMIDCDGSSDSITVKVSGRVTPPGDVAPLGIHNLTSNSSCSVSGWAADPDNELENLNVRVYASSGEGAPVLVDTVVASIYTADMDGTSECIDGTCKWESDLSGNSNIVLGTTYDITAHAQSIDENGNLIPDEWIALNEVAGDLTCSEVLACSPISQSADTGDTVTFSASGGVGSYEWGAPGATTESGSDSTFSTVYNTSGTKTVILTSGLEGISCSAVISAIIPPDEAPICSPDIHGSVNVGVSASFSATGGNGSFSWTTQSGDDEITGTGSTFSPYYNSGGTKYVTVSSSGGSDTCQVNVNPPIGTPTLDLQIRKTSTGPYRTTTPENPLLLTDGDLEEGVRLRWRTNRAESTGTFSGSDGHPQWSGAIPQSLIGKCFASGWCVRTLDNINLTNTFEPRINVWNSQGIASASVYVDTENEGVNIAPEGVHENNNAETCRVDGWAVDPDDRNIDLTTRLTLTPNGQSSQGALVVIDIANKFRADLLINKTCTDGTCGFNTVVSGALGFENGKEYSVVAEAKDAQTGEWITLSDTPKNITCGEDDDDFGTIIVNSNIPTTWTITGASGPYTQTTEITSMTYTDIPAGDLFSYTISPAFQGGYNAAIVDPQSTQILDDGETVTYNITYWAPTFLITDEPQTVAVGQLGQFTAEYDEDGNGPVDPLNVSSVASWVSGDDGVAESLGFGTFRGESLGSINVEAQYNGRIDSGALVVADDPGGVHVSIAAFPRDVDLGGDTILEWTSGNVTSCSAFEGDWRGEYEVGDTLPHGITAQTTITNITESMSFTVECIGSTVRAATAGVQVVPEGYLFNATPDVSINSAPGSFSSPTTVTVVPQGGFLGNVSLSADGSPQLGPADINFIFDDTVLTPSDYNTQLTIQSNVELDAGSYVITVDGASPGFPRSTNFILNVGGGAGGSGGSSITPRFEEF